MNDLIFEFKKASIKIQYNEVTLAVLYLLFKYNNVKTLANKLNVTRNVINRWVSNKNKPSINSIKKISSLIGFEINSQEVSNKCL